MSISSLLFIMTCLGSYKLGVYTERHPGDLWARAKIVWGWMGK
jgi:hypothetical protein